MKNQLFKFTVSRGDRRVVGHVTAHEEQRAMEIVTQTEIENNRENEGVSLKRVDETLPPDQRKGLDTLLQSGCVGLASYNEALGWVTHSVPSAKLHFFQIQEAEGDDYFIIAPTSDVAAALYCEASGPKDGAARLFRILDGFFNLTPDCMRGLPELLENGPISVVRWDDDVGWKLA